jgi:hypothetical protein
VQAFSEASSGFPSGLASSRALVRGNVSTPAIVAAAITALVNLNINGTCPQTQKSIVRKPQTATPTSSIAHSEGFSAKSLPSLATYANIAGTRYLCPDTIATTGGNGCSTRVTHRLNLTAVDG